MIDPDHITNYNLTHPQLEEHLYFWICAAGKNGHTAAKCLHRLYYALDSLHRSMGLRGRASLFKLVRDIDQGKKDYTWLAEMMKHYGIGCYQSKSKAFLELAYAGLDLQTCTVEDLERIHSIGPKTARCFLIHSRPDQPYAGLDVHILRYLRDHGYNAPRSTPTGKKYRELEAIFIKLAKQAKKSVADFDLEIWREYRQRKR
jgi:hypothetical protein